MMAKKNSDPNDTRYNFRNPKYWFDRAKEMRAEAHQMPDCITGR